MNHKSGLDPIDHPVQLILDTLTKRNFRSELTFQKVKKGLSDNIAEEHERTSDEDDIVHEDDVFM